MGLKSQSKHRPSVCIIDEDPSVHKGWKISLAEDADLYSYQNHHELLAAAEKQSELIPSFACIIIGRYFKEISIDSVASDFTDSLKAQGAGPLFLNWQGYVTKEEVNNRFDGKLYHRYGVKWQTLRLRIQKFEKNLRSLKRTSSMREFQAAPASARPRPSQVSRPDKCSEILKSMAEKAHGPHRAKIEYYAKQDPKSGMKLLEAIYARLLTDKNRPDSCPSHYINSSPVIAKRILHEALYK